MKTFKSLFCSFLLCTIFCTQQSSAACNKPNVISIANVDDSSADITWTPIINAIGYQLIVDTSSTINAAKSIYLTVTTFDHDSLDCNIKYYVYVRTVCGVNDTSAWAVDSFTTEKCCLPPTPLTFFDFTISTMRVNMTPVSNALGYEYSISLLPGPPQNGQFTPNTTVLLQGLTYGNLYYFCVKTRCSSGIPVSGWFCDTVRLVIPCDSVTGIKKAFTHDNSAVISWNPVPMAASYEYTITPVSQSPGAYQVTNSPPIIVPGLSADTVYNICVRTVCSTGSVSPWVCDTMKVPLGIQNPDGTTGIKIYPNPAHDRLTIETHIPAEGAQVEIVNTIGTTVFKHDVSEKQTTINISGLPKGVYMVQYKDALTRKTMMLLKQ